MQQAFILALVLAAHAAAQSGWDQLRSLKADQQVSITLRGHGRTEGRFLSWAPSALTIKVARKPQTIPADQVNRVDLVRKGSRWKAALIGGLVGFGAAFPIGVASAGYLTDRNNPRIGTRAGVGAAMGIFGAALGAPIGALTGVRRHVTIFDAGKRP